MTVRPIEEVWPPWRAHGSALWYLGLLYRRPARFNELLPSLPRARALLVGLSLCLHALPYILLVSVLGRLLLLLLLHIVADDQWIGDLLTPSSFASQTAYGIAYGIAFGFALAIRGGTAIGIIGGIALGVAFGIAGGIAVGIADGIAIGVADGIAGGIAGRIALGIALGIAIEIAYGITGGIAGGIAYGIAYGIAEGLAERIGVPREIALGSVGGIVFGGLLTLVGETAVGIALGVAFSIASLRAYYHVAHLVFVWPTAKASWYSAHPVAWDDMCSLPFPGLHELLIAYTELAPEAGAREIERLISSYPSQRMAALRAKAILIARRAAAECDLTRLDGIVAELPEGEKGFLAETRRLREMVGEISQLQRRLDTVDRPIFREPIAALLAKENENFRHQVAGFHQPLASEFRAAAERWLEIAERERREAQAITTKEPTPQVFRAGDPVDRRQEAFVPRQGVIGELERQVMLAAGCPGLLIYGRRRMGKSTLLRNLTGFLPDSVRVLNLSMENPDAFTSLDSFLRTAMAQVRARLPERLQAPDGPPTLSGLFRFLASCNEALEREGERLILAFDEYRYIDEKIGAGVFSADLLATIRESIQSHRRLTWAFAGSHAIDELPHAPWPSYLVSVRTVEVPPFTEPETRLLLTEPLRHSPMWERDDPRRPRFDVAFWGEGGIERVHAEAAGWPHLVQLIAETAVDLLNDEDAHQLNAELLDRALDKAVVRGDTVLRQLMERECVLPGEWDYLRAFRTRNAQPPPDDEAVHRSLRRRLLVAEANGEWHLRVPLMQRWLRQRG